MNAHPIALHREEIPTLTALRAAIEAVDTAIVHAIGERLALARQVGRMKAEAAQPITDPAREAAVVARAARLAQTVGVPDEDIRALYWRLIACSRRAQLDSQLNSQLDTSPTRLLVDGRD